MRAVIPCIPLLLVGAALARPFDGTAAPIVDLDPIRVAEATLDPGAVDPGDAAAVRRWVAFRGRAVERCLGRDFAVIAVVHPPVPLRLVIAADGRVEAAAWTGDPATERCIAEVLQRARFGRRPDSRPITWIGRLDFGFPPRRPAGLSMPTVEVSEAVIERDLRAAAGRPPPLPAPQQLAPWSPRPDWVAHRALWAEHRPLMGSAQCPEPLPSGPIVRRARVWAHWRAGTAERVQVQPEEEPAFARCAAARARADRPEDDAPWITTRVVEHVERLPGDEPRVLPGRPVGGPAEAAHVLRPRVAARRAAVVACYRARLIERPDLAGDVRIGLVARDRSPAFHTADRPGVISTRVAALDGDPALAGCVAAAHDSISVPRSALVRHDPRVGLRLQVSYTFETVPGSPAGAADAAAMLESWLVARGPQVDRTALLDYARTLSDTPEVAAGRAATAIGRYGLADDLFTAVRDRAVAADEPEQALAAQLALAELHRRRGDPADAIAAALLRAADFDTTRVARGGSGADPLSDRLDGLIARGAFVSHRALHAGDATGAAHAARLYRLWQTRSGLGARRRPASAAFVGDARVLENLAHFEADRGDEMRGIALFGRLLMLFPDTARRARIVAERGRLAAFVAREVHRCRPAKSAPAAGETTMHPCPPWLRVLIDEQAITP